MRSASRSLSWPASSSLGANGGSLGAIGLALAAVVLLSLAALLFVLRRFGGAARGAAPAGVARPLASRLAAAEATAYAVGSHVLVIATISGVGFLTLGYLGLRPGSRAE